MFADRATKKIGVQYRSEAGDAPATVTIRRLTAAQRDEAIKVAAARAHVEAMSAASTVTMVSPEMMKALSATVAEGVAESRKEKSASAGAVKNRHLAFDLTVTLNAAIVRWDVPAAEDIPAVSPESIAMLDAETSDTLHRAVIDFTFPLPDDAEATAKNG